jgi:non-ribosomal peptide synthetase component F
MSGRTRSEFQSVVGYFVNPVALRADLSGDPIFSEFLAQTRQRVLEGMAHQDYPFPLLVETLRVHRDPSHSPVFDVLFNLQKIERLTSVASLFIPGGKLQITLDSLMSLTRLHEGELSVCAHTQPGYDVESSGACIMAPQTRQLWALWGNPCQNEYEGFTVGDAAGVKQAV